MLSQLLLGCGGDDDEPPGLTFRAVTFNSGTGPDAPSSYQDVLNIEHVVSDVFDIECWVAGLTEGHPAVIEAVHFDHKPVVCTVEGDL